MYDGIQKYPMRPSQMIQEETFVMHIVSHSNIYTYLRERSKIPRERDPLLKQVQLVFELAEAEVNGWGERPKENA